MSSDNALLIIDMQQGLFRGPVSPWSADAVLANIRLLIANARQAEVPVFVRRDGQALHPVTQLRMSIAMRRFRMLCYNVLKEVRWTHPASRGDVLCTSSGRD